MNSPRTTKEQVIDFAGDEPEEQEDGDFVFLDDDGKQMMSTSHHYTVKDIRALIDDLKAVEQGVEQPEWVNRDHRTRCGVIWRVMAALASDVPVAPLTEAEQAAITHVTQDRIDAERWRVLVDSCGETPLRPAAYGNQLMPDMRLKIDFPTIVSFDAVGNVTTLAQWADEQLAKVTP